MNNIRIHVDRMGHGDNWDFVRPVCQADVDGRSPWGNFICQNQDNWTDSPANNVVPGVGGFDQFVDQICQDAGVDNSQFNAFCAFIDG